ncbi:MAG: hypothetical protein AAF604_16025 [Acidobacteriota bacterium]
MSARFDFGEGRLEDTTWYLPVGIPADSPFFEGHFPESPVLPAVAQLELLRQAWDRLGRSAHLVAIDNLRLASPLLPGDQLSLEIALPDAASGRSSFRLLRRTDEISRGILRWQSGES